MQAQTAAVTGEIVHRLPGRVRVRIVRLHYDIAYTNELKQLLSALIGITEVRVNPAASSVVIAYQVDQLTEPALLEHLGLLVAIHDPRPPDRLAAQQAKEQQQQTRKESLKADIGDAMGADFGEAVGEFVGEGIGVLLGPAGAFVGGGIGAAMGEVIGEKLGDTVAHEHEAADEQSSIDVEQAVREMTAEIAGVGTGEMIGELVGETVGGLLLGPVGMAIGAELGAVLGGEMGEAIAEDIERQIEVAEAADPDQSSAPSAEPPHSDKKPTRRKK